MDKLIDLDIVSPQRLVFQGQVKSVTAPGTLGSFQILNNHAPIVSTLEIGILKVRTASDEEKIYAVGTGILEAKFNKVNVLAEYIDSKEEIDIERERQTVSRAEELLRSDDESIDKQEVKETLNRSLNKIRATE